MIEIKPKFSFDFDMFRAFLVGKERDFNKFVSEFIILISYTVSFGKRSIITNNAMVPLFDSRRDPRMSMLT